VPDTIPGRPRSEVRIYSIADEFRRINMGHLIAVSPTGTSLDSMLNYLTDDSVVNQMAFKQPCRIIAYELSTTWDGKGLAPPMTSDGQTRYRVGEQLKVFATSRVKTKMDNWVLTNNWVAFAPFKQEEIYDTEDVPWE
jgi:hypothetical protein